MNACYQYNFKGERVSKISYGQTTHYIYNGQGQLIAEADSNGAIQQEYIYLNGQRLATIVNGTIYYVHTNQLDAPIALTDETGTLKWQAHYTPFGKAIVDINNLTTASQNQRFPGQYFDSETGMHYNYFRDYDAEIGRYLESDPIGLNGGMSTFGYVGWDPVNSVDPDGLTKIRFNRNDGIITVDPELKGRFPYTMPASSGRVDCDCDETVRDKGPIPFGNYYLYAKDLTNPGLVGDIARNLRGDWGDWRAPLVPTKGTKIHGRDGFFLHGGGIKGSAGCIDVGGGFLGNEYTDRLLLDILNDPDGKVQVRVRK